ncbi:hypothetical protein [Alkalihalobacterium elongatum]|uniref:hypothetical protein n=1 Tax=Alkalihalobacterium elongatum TaxID=2675466 RepID=UPI001C1FA0B6|nr:hypothetical protein [Alkalihalobacterium elongatum]
MKTWKQLFIRHGWMLAELEDNRFNCNKETEANLQFLLECLGKANVKFVFNQGVLILLEKAIEEEKWIESIDFPERGRGEGLWFQPGQESPKVRELDVYISGIVRQLNRLGFYTAGSCDGHGRRGAHVMLTEECNIEWLNVMLLGLGIKRVYWRENRNCYHLQLPFSQNELLDLAEKMSLIDKSWLGQGVDFIREQLFYLQLEQLLMIPGVSGKNFII